MDTCSKCGAVLKDNAMFCTRCASPVPEPVENYCTNPSCINFRKGILLELQDIVCELCGSHTTIGKKVEPYL